MIRVTVWNENLHEQQQKEIRQLYPEGIHGCIASFLKKDKDLSVRTATLSEPEHGLTEAVLAQTDVLIMWSHMANDQFSDEVAERVQKEVLKGMGLIVLHSAHLSKVMCRLMGTSMTLRWKHDDRERLFCTAPGHPIAKGIPDHFDIPHEEMYGEYFDIPKPDDVVFTGWFAGGEVFRSGCTFQRGLGRIFYFQPGHEEYPIYYIPEIERIITNAVHWCSSEGSQHKSSLRRSAPLECTAVKRTLEDEYASGMKLSVFYEHIREASTQSGKQIEAILEQCRREGIEGIDIEDKVLAADFDSTVTKIQNASMRISSIYGFFDLTKNNADEINRAKKLVDYAKTVSLSCGAGCGSCRVLVVPGFLSEEEGNALNKCRDSYEKTSTFMEESDAVQNMKRALTEIVSYAKNRSLQEPAREVTVCLEDFDNSTSPCSGKQELLWFMKNVPGLKWVLDTGNFAFSNENVLDAYDDLKQYLAYVHCKDRGAESGKEGGLFNKGLLPVPTGSGYIPLQTIVEQLKKQNYTGYLAIEHFGAPDQMSYMQQSAQFLSRCLSVKEKK